MLQVVLNTFTRCPTLQEIITSHCQAWKAIKDLSAPSSGNSAASAKGHKALGAGCFRALWVIVVLGFLLSSVSEDHQHVKHIFMHISIWHAGLSCLGLSCFPSQSLLKTGNPISRPALRNHALPLLRIELSASCYSAESQSWDPFCLLHLNEVE